MKKIIFGFICSALTLSLFTGCGNKELEKTDNNENKTEEKTNGKCTAVECIKQINVENTVEEINNIIGINGELTDEKYNKYYWKLSENVGIEVAYYSSTKGTIKLDIDKSKITIKNVDFSKYNELKDKVKSGITYDEFKTYLGNIDGVIVEKSSYSTKYTWASENGSYINGTFSNSSNKCTLLSGVVK